VKPLMLKLGPELFDRLNHEQHVGTQTPVIYGKGGLSPHRIDIIERELGFPLPADFRYLLENIRDPGGTLFPWEEFTRQEYDRYIDGLFDGIAFDIECNNLWMKRWGKRPDTLEPAIAIARKDFAAWPKLLPIYSHRYLAAEPALPDNPVFSIVQTDIVYYGANLANYLLNEFIERDWFSRVSYAEPRRINIWSDFVEDDQSQLAWPSGLASEVKAPWSS